MKKSLAHLPKRKRDELARVVEVIRHRIPQAEMIILFGSHARGDWVESVYVEGHITYEYVSDYDILVLVKNPRIAASASRWFGVKKKLQKLPNLSQTTLIAHDIDYVNRQLARSQYFFSDIKKQGVLLYDSGNCQLARRRKLDPEERVQLAKDDFKQWFKSANGFYAAFEFMLEKRDYKIAAFQLHQATERYYTAAQLVFTGYKPKTHDLETLSRLSAGNDPAFLPVFPQTTPKEKRRFELLCRAYVDARYKKDYKITRAELEYLSERVQTLKKITQKICKKRIKAFVDG